MRLAQQVGVLRRTLRRVLTRRLAAQTDSPLQQLLVLRVISQGDAETQTEVADCLTLDCSAVSRLVDRLEAEGLLRRCEGKDRRSVRLALTPAAEEPLAILESTLEWLDREAEKHLGADGVQHLVETMSRLQAGLAEIE